MRPKSNRPSRGSKEDEPLIPPSLVESPYREYGNPRKGLSFSQTVRQLAISFSVAMPGWKSEEFFTLVTLIFSSAFLGIVEAYWFKILAIHQQAVQNKDWDKTIYTMIPIMLAYNMLKGALKCGQNYQAGCLLAMLRRNMTRKLQTVYMNSKVQLFYVLNDLDKSIDNCDGRISDDVPKYYANIIEFFFGGIIRVQGGVMPLFFGLFGMLMVMAEQHGIKLTLVLVGICICMFVPTVLAAQRVTAVQERQQVLEADLRLAHVKIKMCAEPIKFYGGEWTEHTSINKKTEACIENQKIFAYYKSFLDFLILLQYYTAETLAVVVAIVCATLSSVSAVSSVGVFFIVYKLVKKIFEVNQEIAMQILDYSKAAAHNGRIIELLKCMYLFCDREERLTGHELEVMKHASKVQNYAKSELPIGDLASVRSSDSIIFKNADIFTPTGHRLLLPDVNLELNPGESCLILGPSGIGKSSLLRVLGKLWPLFQAPEQESTELFRPDDKSMFFLAQRPYMTDGGTLREQVAYPLWEDDLLTMLTDSKLQELFEVCNLMDLWNSRKDQLDDININWCDVLSLGEQQRLQFARLFWHWEWATQVKNKPTFYAILDEATAAMDCDSEVIMYRAVRDRGIGFLSVAHRPTVIQFHTKVIRFSWGSESLNSEVLCGKDLAKRMAEVMRETCIENVRPKLYPSLEVPPLYAPQTRVRRDGLVTDRHSVAVMERPFYYTRGMSTMPTLEESESARSSMDSVIQTEKKLVKAIRNHSVMPNSGYVDSDDDETILIRRIVEYNARLKIVQTPYSPYREKEDPSGWMTRMWRMLSLSTSMWVLAGLVMMIAGMAYTASMWEYFKNGLLTILRTNPDSPEIKTKLIYAALFNSGLALAQTTINYANFRVMVRCRANFMLMMNKMYMYFKPGVYYILSFLDKRIDNPDQRLTNDVDQGFQFTFEFLFGGILIPVDAGIFRCFFYFIAVSMVVISTLQSANLEQRWDLYTPLMTLVVFLCCAIPAQFLAKRVVTVENRQEEYLAEFRVAHSKVRANAESIAFYDGSATELSKLENRNEAAYRNMILVQRRRLPLNYCALFFQYGVYTFADILPLMVVMSANASNPSMSGAQVQQMYTTIGSCVNRCMQALLTAFKEIPFFTQASAFSLRVMTLFDVSRDFIEREHQLNEDFGEEMKDILPRESTGCCVKGPARDQLPLGDFVPLVTSNDVQFKAVDVYTPQGDRCLLQDINLHLKNGESCLIMGPSGIGKSSLLRVLGGLWPLVNNPKKRNAPSISRTKNIFFLSQRPYMVQGTLRMQIAYPLWNERMLDELTDDTVERLFHKCNLGEVWRTRREQLDDENVSWEHRLSLGEQQRLQFVRLFYHYEWHQMNEDTSQGFFACLDEATAALDMDSECTVYAALKAEKIGYLSVAHRPTVIPYHDKILQFSAQREHDLPPSYTIVSGREMSENAANTLVDHLPE